MASDDRNFVLRDENGEETSVYSGQTPRQAALKAARRLNKDESEEDVTRSQFRLRQKGTKTLHLRGMGVARRGTRRQTRLDA